MLRKVDVSSARIHKSELLFFWIFFIFHSIHFVQRRELSYIYCNLLPGNTTTFQFTIRIPTHSSIHPSIYLSNFFAPHLSFTSLSRCLRLAFLGLLGSNSCRVQFISFFLTYNLQCNIYRVKHGHFADARCSPCGTPPTFVKINCSLTLVT